MDPIQKEKCSLLILPTKQQAYERSKSQSKDSL